MTTDDRLLSGASSLNPNKSSGDIGELKPCPFCGGPAHTTPGIVSAGLAALVMCSENDCATVGGATLTDAVARWNTRTPDPESAAEIERRDRLISAHQQQIIDGSAMLAAKDAEIERLRREVEDSHARIKRLSDALLTVRPLGGSELFVRWGDKFHADPDYCKEQIDRLRTSYHEAMTTMVRERKRADTAESAVAAALEEAAKIAEDTPTTVSMFLTKREADAATLTKLAIASAIRAAGAERTAESGHSPSTHNSESE